MNQNIAHRVPTLVVPPPTRADVRSQAELQSATDDMVSLPCRPFAAARELLAQSGQKVGRRKKRDPTAIPNARLEHLMCFIDNSRLQNDIQTMEEVFCHQASDLLDINYVRGEEVVRLSGEAQSLRQQMHELDDTVQGCNGQQKCSERSVESSCSEDCHLIQQVVDKRREQIRDLRRQLELQNAELVRAKEATLESQRDAAMEDARSEMLQTLHRQEMQELQKHLSIEKAAFASRPSRTSDPAIRRLQIDSARELLDVERRLHREEVDALKRDLRATNAIITEALSSSAMLHGSDFDTCSESSRFGEDAQLLSSARWRAAGRRKLWRCCEELHRPTSLLLSALEQPAVPQVPSSIADLDVWMKALSTRLSWAREIT